MAEYLDYSGNLFIFVAVKCVTMRWISIVDEMEEPEIWNRCYSLSPDGVTLRSGEQEKMVRMTKDEQKESCK